MEVGQLCRALNDAATSLSVTVCTNSAEISLLLRVGDLHLGRK